MKNDKERLVIWAIKTKFTVFKVMLKIFQARPQQYLNWELPDVQAGFRKGRGARDQIANICWIIEKAKAFQKNIYFCFIDYTKAFDCVGHNKLWKVPKDIGSPSLEEQGMPPCLSPEKRMCPLLLLPSFLSPRHQGLFQWVSCWQQITKILEFQLQHESFLWVFRVYFS